MANVVLIGINYAPEITGTAINNVDMAHSLRDAGHNIVVMTGMPHYPEWRVHEPYRGHQRRTELLDGVQVKRFGHYVPAHNQSALKRGLYEATFLMNAAAVTIRPRPDLFVGIIPALSDGWLARFHAWRSGVRFGLVFADLMGKAAQQSGMPGGTSVAGTVRKFEIGLARTAAGVGIIAEGFRDYFIDGGVQTDRIHRIVFRDRAPNDMPTESRADVRRSMGWGDDDFIVLHSGNMGYKQALDNVLRAAALANHRRNLRFVLIGGGNQRVELENLARRLSLQNVGFLSLVPTGKFDAVLAAADLLLINQRGSVTDMSLPGKLTPYFTSGVPVLAAVASQSEAAKAVVRSGAGLVVSPDRPESLVAGIERLADDREFYVQLAGAGPAYVRNYLDAARSSDIIRFTDLLLGSGDPRFRTARNSEPERAPESGADDAKTGRP
jgi:glycosyltransferase involved in cell wall biosynthesis